MAEKEYVVVAPDGKEITIIGPEGASQDEVIKQAQNLYGQQSSGGMKIDAGPMVSKMKQQFDQLLTYGAGSTAQRVVKGAIIDPVLGTLQLAGAKGAKEAAQRVETATQEGRKAAGSEGFDFAQLGGALLNPQNYLIALKPATLAEGAGVGSRILNSLFGRSVGAGAVAGAAQPVLDTDYAAEKLKQVLLGGVMGGGFAGAGIAAGKVKDVLGEMIKPFTQAGRDSALYAKLKEIIPADVWNDVKDSLNLASISDKARQALGLPTAKQTAAEATAGIPEATGLAAYQKAISKTEGESAKFAAMQADQEAARLANIQRIGGTPQDLAAAEAARESTAKSLYGVSNEALLPGRERQLQQVRVGETGNVPLSTAEGTPRMVEVGRDTITNAPVMQQATSISGNPLYKQVVAGYKYAPEISKLMERPAIKAAFDDAAIIAKNQGIDLFTASGQLTGQGAHLVKLALDDAMSNPNATTALGRNALGAIESSKGAYLNWVEKSVPAYKEAREAFAAQSGPINRMKVGQALEAKLKTSIGDKERAGAFATALNDSAALLKKATGQQRYKSISNILTPDETKAADYVLESLIRKEMANTAAGRTNVSVNMIGKEGHQLPQFLSATATVANTVLRRIRGDANAKITAKFSELLRNPEELAKFMEGIPAKDANAVTKALMYVLPPEMRSALAARIGAVVPIEAYSQETQKPQRRSVFPQNRPQQGLFQQPQSKAEAVNVIAQAATAYGKPELTGLLSGIAKVESNFNPNAKSKSSTAAGMFQFTKATQKDYGLTDPYDAAASAGAAAAYIDKLMQRYKGDKVKALAAYNQGPGVIDKGLNKAGREYAMKVLAASRSI